MTIRFLTLATLCLAAPQAFSDSQTEAPDMDIQAWFVIEPAFDTLDCVDEGFVQAAEVDEHLPQLQQGFSMLMTYHAKVGQPDDDEYNRLAEIDSYVRSAMDTNEDGDVSALELRAYLMELIEAADDDGDGVVTRDELAIEAF